MGHIYRRKWKGKDGNVKQGKVWWIGYYRDGRKMRESSESERESDAKKLLRLREGEVARGVPVTPKVTRVLFRELAQDMVTDYEVNGKRSIRDLQTRLRLHILPFFGHRRVASITTADIRMFIKGRQHAGASNGEINRELTALKRAFSLGVQSAKILTRPHVPMLHEDNVREGFFEREQFEALRSNLPDYLKGIVTFAYVTGWRTRSEILPLTWSQVDFAAGTVRLEPGTTKNREGRTFYVTGELRATLEAQRRYTDDVQREKSTVVPWVFHRAGKRIAGFRKAWARACHAAGLPVEIRTEPGPDGKPRIEEIKAKSLLHDFRRTAVRNLVRAGISESIAMKMTGHKTRSVFERYNIVSPNDLMDAARKLDQFHDDGVSTGTKPGTARQIRMSRATASS